jgi:prepilin-type N-terminal cleavage/methylation domain-containing protein
MAKCRRWLSLRGLSSFRRSEKGLTLLEVLMALSILAIVSTTYLVGMATSSRAVIANQEHVNAENLAKSQMEAVKGWDYDDVNDPPDYEAARLTDDVPAGYDINIAAERLETDTTDPLNPKDGGLQQITVTISRSGRTIFTLEGYKCLIEEQ